jgi:hypothetical protein
MDPEQQRPPQSSATAAAGAGQVGGSSASSASTAAASTSSMQQPPVHMPPTTTRRSSVASAPALSALSIPLPTFPVLPPPSVGDPHQTFQTPSQVSAILSLPPPLLMQLARTDSPVEQLHIAEKRGVKSYLSAMAIPPPSPTSLVESIARENAAGFVGGTSTFAGDANGHGGAAAGMTTTSAGGHGGEVGVPPATNTRPALNVPLSIPLSLPNFTAAAASSSSSTTALTSDSNAVASTSSGGGGTTTTSSSNGSQAQLALPLLLGQVFAPPPLTPGVLAPIPGFGSVSSLFATSSTAGAPLPPDAGSTPTSPTAPPRIAFAPSVDAWSLHTASQRAAEGAGTEPKTGTDDGTTGLDVGDLARQIKDWALETQERHVEVQVAEAKAAAVVLAAQVQAQEAADTGTGLGTAAGGLVTPAPSQEVEASSTMSTSSSTARGTTSERDKDGLKIYAEAYKKQLDALASGYFAQLHRDALQRLEDETRSRAAAEATATAGEGARASGGGGAVSEGWSLPRAASSNLTAADSSLFGSTNVGASSSSAVYSTFGSTAPLSSSQAPTLQSLTTLTSSRSQAEAMHVRASAAAAVAAQVMAAQDLARSAGEKLVELGVDPRKVVEEVGGMVDRTASETSVAGLEEIIDKAVASATSRRGSRDERSTPATATGAGAGPSSETMMHRTLSSGAKSDAMSIEDVGQPALPASTSTAAATAPSTISADATLSGAAAAAATSGQASVADLASLPHANRPPSTARQPPTTSTSSGGFDGVNAAATAAGHAAATAEAYPPQPPYGMPGQTTTAAEYAALATPEKRDYLLSYAHQLYSSEPQSPQLLPLLHTLEALHPDHLPTLLLISCVYYSRGELESSLYYNKRLLQIDPSYVSLPVDDGNPLARRSLTHFD